MSEGGGAARFLPYWHQERNPHPPAITEAREYTGAPDLAVLCTQLGSSRSPTQQRQIVDAWCELLATPTPVRRLWLLSRVPQRLLDAVGGQRELESLFVKWSVVTSLAALTGLDSLVHLFLGSAAGVADLRPLAALPRLEDLFLGNCQAVTDYAPLGDLRQLRHLTLAGDGFAPKTLRLPSLSFVTGLRELRSLTVMTATVLDGSYEPLLGLDRLEHLVLPKLPEPARRRLAAALPYLRTGNVCSGPPSAPAS